MQKIIIEKPYRFIPPHRGDWIPSLIQRFRLNDYYLSHFEGVESHEIRHAERLSESLRRGDGIILAPNHCRYADPIALGWLARQVGVHLFAMASWHLYHHHWLKAWAIRLCGGFSVYREGVDRQSLDTAISAVVEARRPLVVFPEGAVFRTNDRLAPLLDGVSFLARNAAKRREKAGLSRAVIHPVAIKYLSGRDLTKSVEQALKSLEKRLGWAHPPIEDGPLTRVRRLNEALLCLAEVRYFQQAQKGTAAQRRAALIEHLLGPLEQSWLGKVTGGNLLTRVKQLRTTMVPRLLQSDLSAPQRAQLWKELDAIYHAQQIGSYPTDYLQPATEMRMLEMLERTEEDLTGRVTIHRPLHAVLQVGHPIEVPAAKPPRGQADPLLEQLRCELEGMLDELSRESPIVEA
jgi:1-acyl-sn-glycerol-3-phosphate acyltransferase